MKKIELIIWRIWSCKHEENGAVNTKNMELNTWRKKSWLYGEYGAVNMKKMELLLWRSKAVNMDKMELYICRTWNWKHGESEAIKTRTKSWEYGYWRTLSGKYWKPGVLQRETWSKRTRRLLDWHYDFPFSFGKIYEIFLK